MWVTFSVIYLFNLNKKYHHVLKYLNSTKNCIIMIKKLFFLLCLPHTLDSFPEAIRDMHTL